LNFKIEGDVVEVVVKSSEVHEASGSPAGPSAVSPDTDGSPGCGSLPGTSGDPQLHGSTGISPCTKASLQVYTTGLLLLFVSIYKVIQLI